MADEDNRITFPGETNRLGMDFRHQRAGGIDGFQSPLGSLSANFGGDAMSRVEKMGTFGNFGKIIDENHAFRPKMFDHPAVVDNLVINVQWRPERLDRQFEAFNRHIHPGTKAPGTC